MSIANGRLNGNFFLKFHKYLFQQKWFNDQQNERKPICINGRHVMFWNPFLFPQRHLLYCLIINVSQQLHIVHLFPFNYSLLKYFGDFVFWNVQNVVVCLTYLKLVFFFTFICKKIVFSFTKMSNLKIFKKWVNDSDVVQGLCGTTTWIYWDSLWFI